MSLSRLFGILFLNIFLLDCATYWANRKNDAKDVFQAGVETPVYGIGFRVGPIPIGFFFAGGETETGKRDLGSGVGLRGGEVGSYHSQQLVFGYLGGEKFHSGEPMRDDEGEVLTDDKGIPLTENERANLKSYNMRYFSFFSDPVADRQKRKKDAFMREYIEDRIPESQKEDLKAYIPEPDPKPFGYPSHFSYQVDLFFGVHGGLRVGFNFAELLDFLLGFTTVDILKDDVAGE